MMIITKHMQLDIYTDGGYKSWSYNLQNNIENVKNIKLIYSQIFKDISKE